MKKNCVICLLAIIFVIYIITMLYNYHFQNGILLNAEFGNYLSGVFAPISAIGTIAVSYLIYELTSTERRADDDFKIIIGLYYKIEESFELLKKQNLKNDLFDDHNSFYERQIKVDCMLLLNYIRRYPHKKYDIKKLEDVIMAINVNPNYESDYIKLAEEFQNFCFALNPDWNTLSFTLDKNEKN